MAIKALFFDLDDTLHSFRESSRAAMDEVYRAITSRYPIDPERLRTEYLALLRQAEEDAFFDGKTSKEYRTKRFSNLLKAFGIEDPQFADGLVQLYSDVLERSTVPFPDTISCLEELGKHYDLYLITEGPEDAQRKAVDILGLTGYFEDIVISGQIKKIKSTGELFEASLERSGLRPEEVIVIGDSIQRDIKGAMKAGIKGVWLNRLGAKPSRADPTPWAQLNTLEQLAPLIKDFFLPDRLTRAFDRRQGDGRPVLILGHPRSGTNFLSSIIMSHPHVSFLVEPFSLHCSFFTDNDLRYWDSSDFDPALFNRDLISSPDMQQFLKDFTGWIRFPSGDVKAFKETTLFLKMGWLKQWMPDLKVIYVERDPIGVVSSFKTSNLFERWGYGRRFGILEAEVRTKDELVRHRGLVADTDKGSWVDMLTTIWIVRTSEARSRLGLFDHIIVPFDDLLDDPHGTFSQVFDFMGLFMDNRITEAIDQRRKRSKGGIYSTFRDPEQVKSNWQLVLGENEKRVVRDRVKGGARGMEDGRSRKNKVGA